MTTLILTVLDYPNDNITFIAETNRATPSTSDHTQCYVNMDADYLTSKDILTILGGQDTRGDTPYFGALEVRYFDGTSFVARANNADHTYRQITGMVSRSV